jgi:hypothetical protein
MSRRNLKVATSAIATRVVMEGDKAVAVEWFDAKGRKHTTSIKQGGEVTHSPSPLSLKLRTLATAMVRSSLLCSGMGVTSACVFWGPVCVSDRAVRRCDRQPQAAAPVGHRR